MNTNTEPQHAAPQTYATTDLDMAAWLDFQGWETANVERVSGSRLNRFTFRIPADCPNWNTVVEAFDCPVDDIVPSRMFAARSSLIKKMHRLCPNN